MAHRAWVVNDHATTATLPAGLGHCENTARRRGLHAAALTGRADPRNRTRSRTSTATGLACRVGHHLHRDGYALDRLDEVDGDLTLDVTAPAWTTRCGVPRRLSGRTAVEQATEDVTEPASGVPEQVVNRRAALPGTRSRKAEAAAAEQPPGLVVLLALVRIREHIVGF